MKNQFKISILFFLSLSFSSSVFAEDCFLNPAAFLTQACKESAEKSADNSRQTNLSGDWKAFGHADVLVVKKTDASKENVIHGKNTGLKSIVAIALDVDHHEINVFDSGTGLLSTYNMDLPGDVVPKRKFKVKAPGTIVGLVVDNKSGLLFLASEKSIRVLGKEKEFKMTELSVIEEPQLKIGKISSLSFDNNEGLLKASDSISGQTHTFGVSNAGVLLKQ